MTDSNKHLEQGIPAHENFQKFVAHQAKIHVQKNTDYDSRFMRALIDHQGSQGGSRAIWAWETDKKLDRLRTWLRRGELLVKDEGVSNSVGDLFNYTVQYSVWLLCNRGMSALQHDMDPMRHLSEESFKHFALQQTPEEWVHFLIQELRITPKETELQLLIRRHMGDDSPQTEWEGATHPHRSEAGGA